MVKEEVATNNAGSGNIDGIGIEPKGEPGVDKKNKRKVILGLILKRRDGSVDGK